MTPLEFEVSNESRWIEFESLLEKPDRELDAARFLTLYRTCCEHLALARSREFPAHVVERLAIMTAHGHQIVYRQSGFGWSSIGRFLFSRFPASVRAHRRYVLVAALLFLIPVLSIGVATYVHPDLILSFVDSRTAGQFESMYSPTAGAIGRARDAGGDWFMFGFYIMNNIGIAFQCYVTGILFGVGTIFFLLFNGVFGGAIGGYIAALGFGSTFFPFIATHSAFELTAIVLCGAAGLRIGRSVLLPGRLPRLLSVQNAARETSPIVAGSAAMLVVAAAVEAFWSSAVWVSPVAKYLCALACWSLVTLFFLRRAHAD